MKTQPKIITQFKKNSCPLCHIDRIEQTIEHWAWAQDIEYFTSKDLFEISRCKSCDVLFITPMLFDRLTDIYPTNYYSFGTAKRSVVEKTKAWLDKIVFRKVLRKIVVKKIRALDIGGGSGWLLNTLRASDSRVQDTWVVDTNPLPRQLAEVAGHSFFEGPLEQFQTELRFDIILMLNVIEHVINPRELLGKARDLLAPGGMIIVNTPNFDAYDARLFRHSSWGGYHTPRHFVIFNRESFIKMAQDINLEVESFNYVQGAAFWSVSLLNAMRRLGIVSITQQRPAIDHPIMPILQIVAAAFDFARAPFSNLSQMRFVLRRK
jgi:2-polyprenyl-3-methyl-5-hydroxy-6-metoxy-1,4-benzoquinol methylase